MPIPVIYAEVELLIGTDATNVINSKGDGPFAVNGPLGRHNVTGTVSHPTVQRNRISIAKVDQSTQPRLCEKASEDKPEMSVEERKFMKCANDSITPKDSIIWICLSAILISVVV